MYSVAGSPFSSSSSSSLFLAFSPAIGAIAQFSSASSRTGFSLSSLRRAHSHSFIHLLSNRTLARRGTSRSTSNSTSILFFHCVHSPDTESLLKPPDSNQLFKSLALRLLNTEVNTVVFKSPFLTFHQSSRNLQNRTKTTAAAAAAEKWQTSAFPACTATPISALESTCSLRRRRFVVLFCWNTVFPTVMPFCLNNRLLLSICRSTTRSKS